MEYTLGRALTFVGIAITTIVLAYLYQRRERTQRVRAILLWPAIFALLAIPSLLRELPKDPSLVWWLLPAFVLGLAIGVVRGIAFGVRPGAEPGQIVLRPNLVSGAIYVVVLAFNEFVHVFYRGDPNLGRISCGILILTVGNSLAVNLTRLVRYRRQVAGGGVAAGS